MSTARKLEMPELSRQVVEKGVKAPRSGQARGAVAGSLESLPGGYVVQEDLEDIPFPKTIRKTPVRGALALPKRSGKGRW